MVVWKEFMSWLARDIEEPFPYNSVRPQNPQMSRNCLLVVFVVIHGEEMLNTDMQEYIYF